MSVPQWKVDNLRQYRHNDNSGLVFAYDKDGVDALVDDLLAALQALDDYICNNLTGEYPTGVDVDSEAFKAARAAIAKATGGQP